MTQQRNDNGQYTGKPEKQRVLDVMQPGEAYTTGEIKDHLDTNATRRTVYNWLQDLADTGHVHRRKANERLILWWRSD